MDDSGQRRVVGGLGGSEFNRPALVDCSGENFIADFLGNRNRFARNGRLINGGGAVGHQTIQWNPFTRAHENRCSHRHLLDGLFKQIAIVGTDIAGHRGRQVHQRRYSPSRASHAPVFEHKRQRE